MTSSIKYNKLYLTATKQLPPSTTQPSINHLFFTKQYGNKNKLSLLFDLFNTVNFIPQINLSLKCNLSYFLPVFFLQLPFSLSLSLTLQIYINVPLFDRLLSTVQFGIVSFSSSKENKGFQL